jgi:hypothetical protein
VGAAVFWGFTRTAFYDRMTKGQGPLVVQEALPALYVTDPDVGPMLVPHTRIHFRTPSGDNTVTTNADGFTGRDYPVQKSNYRIAIMGDSAVEAYGVPDTSRFTYVTEALVYSKSAGKLKVDFMGFGVSGWGTVHQYGALRKYVLKYRPDEVWLMFLATNDTGDNTPLLNGPPNGPTFLYKDASSNEIVDIRFGYPDLPDALQAERKRRYGKYLDDTQARWSFGLLPHFWSAEHDPQWDLVMDHNLQTLRLVKKLCAENGIKVVLLYRMNPYERSAESFDAFRKEASAFLKRDLPMDRELGVARFRKQVEDLGIEFMDTRNLAEAGIGTRKAEAQPDKHLELAQYLSDRILERRGAGK